MGNNPRQGKIKHDLWLTEGEMLIIENELKSEEARKILSKNISAQIIKAYERGDFNKT